MKLPKNWEQITIGQFQQLQKLTEPTFDNQIKTLAVLSNYTQEQIEDLPVSKVADAVAKLSFMADLPKPKHITGFWCGNYVYKFAANQHQLTAGQFITIQDLIQSGNWIDNLHKIMAALCVPYRVMWPKRCELKAQDFERVSELFKNKMPISLAYAYTLFFSTCWPQLQDAILAYLKQEAATMKQTLEDKTEQV
jgi:hypothetical protein